MNPSFAIGIPTLNRMDLLRPALEIYLKNFPSTSIYVVDNGNQPDPVVHPSITWLYNPKNIGVAASWNQLCQAIFKNHAAALILNDDIIYNRTAEELINFLRRRKANCFVSLQEWCVFLLKKETWQRVGPFDEQFFPAYYEDTDYERRLKLSGLGFVRDMFFSPAVFRNNSTGALLPSVYEGAARNKAYYISKWGGLPPMEKYLVPFNKKAKK